jgi:hypothetical protein
LYREGKAGAACGIIPGMTLTGPAEQNPVALCKSCGAEGRWMKTSKGKHILVELASCSPNDHLFGPKRHIAHFANCPQAAAWRRRPKEPEAE